MCYYVFRKQKIIFRKRKDGHNNDDKKETLRGYLHNYPLVQAIEQKRSIDETRKKLCDAVQVMREAGVIESATMEAQNKADEYSKISQAYGHLIEDTWGITWQMESIIRKYTGCLDDDIDRLPDCVRAD